MILFGKTGSPQHILKAWIVAQRSDRRINFHPGGVLSSALRASFHGLLSSSSSPFVGRRSKKRAVNNRFSGLTVQPSSAIEVEAEMFEALHFEFLVQRHFA